MVHLYPGDVFRPRLVVDPGMAVSMQIENWVPKFLRCLLKTCEKCLVFVCRCSVSKHDGSVDRLLCTGKVLFHPIRVMVESSRPLVRVMDSTADQIETDKEDSLLGPSEVFVAFRLA